MTLYGGDDEPVTPHVVVVALGISAVAVIASTAAAVAVFASARVVADILIHRREARERA